MKRQRNNKLSFLNMSNDKINALDQSQLKDNKFSKKIL